MNSNNTQLVLRLAEILKGSPYAKGGLLLLALGSALLTYGWIISIIMLAAGTPIQGAIEGAQPGPLQTAIACVCLVTGTALLRVAYRVESKKAPPTVIAINHQSFDGLARRLLPSDLPIRLRKARVVDVPIEQSQWFEAGHGLDVQGALGQLRGVPSKISGLRQSHPDAEFAFAGKAHIPLAFWLAHRCFSEVPLLAFELDRSTGAWRHLPEAPHQLNIRSTASGEGGTADAVIKIEVSYSINDADIAAIVPNEAARRTIAVEPPALDCVTTRGDAEEIANRFRAAMDDLVDASMIHVFIAAPMSVVAALGRRVSPTIHAPMVVHNFTDKTRPRYAWGIHINSKDGPKLVQN